MVYENEIRRKCRDNSALAYGVATKISEMRQRESTGTELAARSRTAYIINSLKHPAEVQKLREIYTHGFFAIGVFADDVRRSNYLVRERQILHEQAQTLIVRGTDETLPYGQHTSDTFHLSDFFVHYDSNIDKLKRDLWQFLDLIFGKPYITPTFDEFAMFMAFASALRSADLLRQVGAIIARDEQILSTGANDTPRFGGGLYLPQYDNKGVEIVDTPDGRDYMRGIDSNSAEKNKIIQEIVQNASDAFKEELKKLLKNSRLNDITEYGRVVHAEIEAILACSRAGISSKGATLYSTTFPCHTVRNTLFPLVYIT
jgi:deoxycytidylate deaminase